MTAQGANAVWLLCVSVGLVTNPLTASAAAAGAGSPAPAPTTLLDISTGSYRPCKPTCKPTLDLKL